MANTREVFLTIMTYLLHGEEIMLGIDRGLKRDVVQTHGNAELFRLALIMV